MKVWLKQVVIKLKRGGGKILLKQPKVLLTAAGVAQQPRSPNEETGKEGNKPANGTPESSSNSQSGAGKKVQTLRAGFHSTKPRNAALITVHQSAVALQAAVLQQVQAEQQRGPKPGGGVRPWGRVSPGGASPRRWEQRRRQTRSSSPAAACVLCSPRPSLRNLQRPVILVAEPPAFHKASGS